MGAVRGALVGALGLIVLEVATSNVSGVADLIAQIGGDPNGHPGLVGRALSADVPLIPDHRKPKKPESTTRKVLNNTPLLPGIPFSPDVGSLIP